MKYSALNGLLVALLLGISVTSTEGAPDAQERGRLSTKMANLSLAVNTYFSTLGTAPSGSDAVILRNATYHDPHLLAPEFAPYLLKVRYQNRHAVLLLCSKDGIHAIMEDAGCSARIDRQYGSGQSCHFTLHVSQGCLVSYSP